MSYLMRHSQDDVFVASEGDKWFERNRKALEQFDTELDPVLRLMELYGLRPAQALEVGAANGCRLAAVADRYNSRVIAVEPSWEAIKDGRARFSNVSFVRGAAYSIPLKETFDLIIVNFVFHWIDRTNLFPSISEIDRLLGDGGLLVLGDFLPFNAAKVSYHHLKDKTVFTYKQDYAEIFLASGLYDMVALLTTSHTSKDLVANASQKEKVGTWLLRKTLDDHYAEARLAL